MKKIFLFASMMLAAAMNYSCSEYDNAVISEEDESTFIELDGEAHYAKFIAAFKAEKDAEVSLTLGVYADYDIYGVDFGDGNIVTDTVGNENKGVANVEGTTHTSATKFTGTVAGDGIIKVYGNSDLWYVVASGSAIPLNFEASKLANVVQMSITGANVERVELPALKKLKQFSLNNSPVKSVDVSKATALTSLTINNTTASKFEPQLESIDVSNNTELTYLSLQGNQNSQGQLTTIDLTNNTKLENVYVQYNQLKEVKLADAYEKLGIFNGQNNQLTEFDASKTLAIKSLYLADNQIKSIDVSKCEKLAWFDVKNNQLEGDIDLTANEKLTNVYVNGNQLTSVKVKDVTKQFYFDNNKMTFATIPALPASMNTTSKIKQFHYAPQAALQVAEELGELDLSAQLNVQGILEAPATTTITFVTAGGATLEEGTDYEATAPGKFKFIKEQSEKVHAVLANEALPLFADADAFVTTEFTVKLGGQAEPVAEGVKFTMTEGTVYTSGQTVQVAEGLTITFGEQGGEPFHEVKAISGIEGYATFTDGNGINGNKEGGTFYIIKTEKAGTIEIAVSLNADKKFAIEEDGTKLADYNDITVAEKYNGTYTFAAKAGSTYKFYASGSKLGFAGFKFN